MDNKIRTIPQMWALVAPDWKPLETLYQQDPPGLRELKRFLERQPFSDDERLAVNVWLESRPRFLWSEHATEPVR